MVILTKIKLSDLQIPHFQKQIWKIIIKGTAIIILSSNKGEKQDCIHLFWS